MNRRISPVHRHTGLWFVGTFTDAKFAFYIPMIHLTSWLLYSHLRGLVDYQSKCIGMTCVHRHTNYSTLIPHTPLKKKGMTHMHRIFTLTVVKDPAKNLATVEWKYRVITTLSAPGDPTDKRSSHGIRVVIAVTSPPPQHWLAGGPRHPLEFSPIVVSICFYLPPLPYPVLTFSPLVYLSLPPPHSYSLDLPPSPSSSSSSLPLTIYPSKNLSYSHIFICHISFYYFQSSFVYYHSHIN